MSPGANPWLVRLRDSGRVHPNPNFQQSYAFTDQALRDVWLGIEARYQLRFLEIGADRDHVHFLVQSVPTYSVTKLVTTIKSLTAREILRRCPQVKKQLWSWEFWTDGYFASTVGRHANEATISDYVK